MTSGTDQLVWWHPGCTGWARRSAAERGRHRGIETRAPRTGGRQTWPRKIADSRQWIGPNNARLRARVEKRRTRRAPRTSGRAKKHVMPDARAESRAISGDASRWAAAATIQDRWDRIRRATRALSRCAATTRLSRCIDPTAHRRPRLHRHLRWKTPATITRAATAGRATSNDRNAERLIAEY